ncbi:teichoic acid glycosylation protein [Bacillus sp. MUM 116]|uniref:GtrA family protein n=1 Tax=Bacillus sp. MUM 116 TaxID=1678002 RepID=UPI0008F5AC37|nr:GtrA family protein [Bacillus sp. MUM 116]OIK16330.1 teichoic acid glycosylation protein [Bacillus sp. MUM 116]
MKKDLYRIMMYLIMGGFTTLVNIVVYWVSSVPFKSDYRLATTYAWIAAVLFAYVTNKRFVFESHTPTLKDRLIEMGSFFGFRLLSFFMDLGVMIALVSGFGMNGTWAKVWSNVVVLVANYVFSKWFIFKNREQTP